MVAHEQVPGHQDRLYGSGLGWYVPGMVTRPVILEHGVSATRPVVRKVSLSDRPGPGLTDMHWAAEIGIVHRGRMRRSAGAWTAEFGPGDVWLQGMWEVQSAEIIVAPLELIMLHVHPPLLAGLAFPEGPSANWLAWFTSPPDGRPTTELMREAEAWIERTCRELPPFAKIG